MTTNNDYAQPALPHVCPNCGAGMVREGELEQEVERLRALLAADYTTQPCGHTAKWLAYRNAVDVRSERYCVFCEVERLRAALAKYASPLIGTTDRCSDCGCGLLFSAREIGDGYCHACAHLRFAACRALLRKIVKGEWCVTDVQEFLGDIEAEQAGGDGDV